jgi:CRP/FNR family transcriptional regulator
MSLDVTHREVLVNFFKTGTKLQFDKGEFIVRPGEAPRGVFFIESGLVKSYDITKYGEENLLVIRKAGELLGMTAAITGYERRIIYTALAPTVIWMVPGEKLTAFLEANPVAALPLVAMITDMYRINSERVLNLEYRTVRERLVSFLLTTAGRFGVQTAEGIVIDVPLRHQDIASSISATRETTGRELTALERRGLISNRSLYVTLLDVEALKRFL